MMRIIIILGIFLGTICLFENKINKLKMFSTVKTISCDRQNNYPKDFQYDMVYLYITYIFIYLVNTYGKDDKYIKSDNSCSLEIYLNTKTIHIYSASRHIPIESETFTELHVILNAGRIIKNAYDVVINTRDQEILTCKNNSINGYPYSGEIMMYTYIVRFGKDIVKTISSLIAEDAEQSEDDELFKAISILDYYSKGDFENYDD
jgi:hypothetical protein